jgi:large subunit ribosomal protein L5
MATVAPDKPVLKTPRMKTAYREQYANELKQELKLSNINEVPKLTKIVLNIGMGRAKDEKRLLEVGANTLSKISGQSPIQTTAKVSIASFKLREGSKIGLKVTLRGDRMYEFADRLINLVLPRLRDFRGVSAKSFDMQGNYSIGLSDQSVFPELSFEDTATTHGLQIVFVVSGQGPEHSRALLEKFGLPFEKENR